MRQIIKFSKKVSGFTLTIFPSILALMQFFLKIDDISDIEQYYYLQLIVNYITPYTWTIVITLSVVFVLSYILSHFFAYYVPITTGGHLQEFENTKLKSFYTIRHTPEGERFMDNRESSYFVNIRTSAENMCDKIANLMQYNFDKEFSVCIKLIDISSARVTTSAEEVSLHTFCRGGKDKISRAEHDIESVQLTENSDFLSIFQGAPYFSTGNFRAYKILQKLPFGDKKPYFNSTEKYEKKYLSTIVVPIRLENRYVHNYYCTKDTNGNQLLGFLCIDCKHRCSPHTIKKMLPYMQAFADNLYLYFDEILIAENENRKSNGYPVIKK